MLVNAPNGIRFYTVLPESGKHSEHREWKLLPMLSPVQTQKLKWTSTFNFAVNKNLGCKPFPDQALPERIQAMRLSLPGSV